MFSLLTASRPPLASRPRARGPPPAAAAWAAFDDGMAAPRVAPAEDVDPLTAARPAAMRSAGSPMPARAFRSALEQVAYSTNAALLGGACVPVARRPRGLGAFFGGR